MAVNLETQQGRSLGKGLDLQGMNPHQLDGWITERRSRIERMGFNTPMEEVVQAVRDGGIGSTYEDTLGSDGRVKLTPINLLMGFWHFSPDLVQENLGDFAEASADLSMGVGVWQEKTGEIGLPQSLTKSLEPAQR